MTFNHTDLNKLWALFFFHYTQQFIGIQFYFVFVSMEKSLPCIIISALIFLTKLQLSNLLHSLFFFKKTTTYFFFDCESYHALSLWCIMVINNFKFVNNICHHSLCMFVLVWASLDLIKFTWTVPSIRFFSLSIFVCVVLVFLLMLQCRISKIFVWLATAHNSNNIY